MFVRLLLRSLSARASRLLLALLAVTLGIAVATALATLALQVGDDLARTLRAAGPNFVVLPTGARWPLDLGGAAYQPARAGLALRDSAVFRLKQGFWRNNVIEAAPELGLSARVNGTRATVMGTWFDRPLVLPDGIWRTGQRSLRPHWSLSGRWPREDADEIALGRDLAARTGLRVGDWTDMVRQRKTAHLRVSGLVAAGGLDDRRAWVPLAIAQSLAERPGEVDRVWLSALVRPATSKRPPDAARDPIGYERYMCTAYPDVVARSLGRQLTGAEVMPMSEVVAGEGQVVSRLNLLMLLLGLAALTASTLGLLSTTTATVVERRVELSLMRALGASQRQLAALVFGETLVVSSAGGLLGWLLGSLAAALIRGDTFGAGSSARPLLLPVALVLALAVAILGTLVPLRIAQSLEPAGVLRGQA